MKKEYKIKSGRYGYTHTLRQCVLNDGRGLPLYELLTAEEWMTIGVTTDTEKNQIMALDPDGGPYLTVGWSNEEICIDEIILCGDYIFLRIHEL